MRYAILSCAVLAVVATLTACEPGGMDFDREAAIARGEEFQVTIIRDEYGMPHIYGETDADTAYGLAFVHMEDDYPTLVEAMLGARGQIAAVQGRDGAPIDYIVRLLGVWEDVEAKYESDLSPEVRALCEAYADGINHFGALHPDKLPNRHLPLTGKDVVAGFVLKTPFFYGLDGTLRELMESSERRRPVSERAAAGPVDPIGAFEVAGDFLRRGLPVGSNTFAVAPSRSADGATRLAINSHQPWEGPVAWYEARMHSNEGYDMIGGVFPGTPIILHGHNRNLGWAHTVNSPDLVDVYVLKMNPENENQYEFDGEWLDLEVETVTLRVRVLGPIVVPIQQEILRSVHGPAVRTDHGVYALRYAGMNEIRQVEQWYRMGKAQNLEEFLAAKRTQGVPSFNTGYADKDGNIGYINNAQLPVRTPGYDYRQYLPGHLSETLWTEYHDFDAGSPQVWNPASGFIQNCNDSPWITTTGDDNPRKEDFCPHAGFRDYHTNRSLRAMELFSADDSITREAFYAYKHDDAYSEESVAGQLIEILLNEHEPEDDLMEQVYEILRNWDMRTNIENTNAAIPVMAMHRRWLSHTQLPNIDDIKGTLREVAEELMEHHGTLTPPWGDVNRLRRGDLDIPVSGGPDVLRALYALDNNDGTRTGAGGDCYIVMVEWDEDGNLRSESIHQYGSAISLPDSPHYNDQAVLFANEEYKPVHMDEDAVRAVATRIYRPGAEDAR